MVKVCIFVEDRIDFQTSLEYIKSHGGNILVVNLNPDTDFDYSEHGNVTYKTEPDYVEHDTFLDINDRALFDGQTWHEEPFIKELLTYSGIDMGLIIQQFFSRALITTYKYVRLIKKILLQEGICKVVLIVPDLQLHYIRNIIPTIQEKLANDIVLALKEKYSIQVESIASRGTVKHQIGKEGISGRQYVIRLLGSMRELINLVLSVFAFRDKTIVFTGAPRLMFPIIDAMNRCKRYRLIYLQKEAGLRLTLPLIKKGVIHKGLRDYGYSRDKCKIDNFKYKLLENFDTLMNSERLHKKFTFDEIDVMPILKSRIAYIFEEFIPSAMYNIVRFKRFLKKENIHAVVMDEDVKEFNCPLALTATSLGIVSLEYLHGVPAYFHAIRSLSATKKLVWGNYLKQRFVDAGFISSADIFVSGSPHIEASIRKKANRDTETCKVRKDFRIQNNKRIILFTPHSFKRGAKGGIIGVHVSRKEAEMMLSAIVKTVNQLLNVFLLVKLHHGDSSNESYYMEMLKKNGLATSYKIATNYSVYTLLNTCDLLLSPLSTAIPEGLALNTPIIMLNFTRRLPLHPYAEWGAVTSVTSEDQLYLEARRILKDKEGYLQETECGRQKVLDRYLNGIDGKSSARIVRLIKELAK